MLAVDVLVCASARCTGWGCDVVDLGKPVIVNIDTTKSDAIAVFENKHQATSILDVEGGEALDLLE